MSKLTADERVRILSQLMGDSGWRGALHILSCPLLERKGVWSFVDLERRTFNYRLMLKRCGAFSSGEYRLLEVAASLFNEEKKVNLWELVNGLDDTNLRLVIDAIAVARGWKPASEKRVQPQESEGGGE